MTALLEYIDVYDFVIGASPNFLVTVINTVGGPCGTDSYNLKVYLHPCLVGSNMVVCHAV